MSTTTRVATSHSYTGRMCAASRGIESKRSDSLFTDPLGDRLAGDEAIDNEMGAWILVPRTRFGDDLLRKSYDQDGARQLVMLGAGMDARAFRMQGLPELKVFEVDQATTFDIKEPLVRGEELLVESRHTVATDFSHKKGWGEDLVESGFDPSVPTVWLLEGLLMYLSMPDTVDLMQMIGELSAPKSVVFHDAITASYVRRSIQVAGAKFIGGSDEYAGLWAQHAGFSNGTVHDFNKAILVDRQQRRLIVDRNTPEASPGLCRGHDLVLFVEARKG